jgi:serpin B
MLGRFVRRVAHEEATSLRRLGMRPGIGRALSIPAVALACVITCAAQDDPAQDEQADEAKAVAEWDANALRAARMEDLQASGLCRAESRFGMELLQQLVAADPAANHLVAPLGAFTMLNLLSEGASEPAREKIGAVLHVQALDRASLRRALETLRQSLTSREFATIDVACALWSSQGFAPSPAFLAAARDGYGATVGNLDFADPGALKTINAWAAASTREAIPSALHELSADAPMLALTVTSFSAEWLFGFDADGTKPHTFTDEAGRASDVPMMHVYQDFAYKHDADLGAQMVQLPTSAVPQHAEELITCSLYVILPDRGHSVRSVLDDLMAEPLSWRFSYRLFAESSETSGNVRMPRFRFAGEVPMREMLGRMGLKDVLKGASFPGIAPGMPDFDQVQSTTINVDETGITATSVDETTVFGSPSEESSFDFVADHPFIYVVFDEVTGALLYAGVMAKPD